MFPDQPELKQGAVISEIHQIHTRRIYPASNGRQEITFSRRSTPREMKMSMFGSLGRFGTAITHAHNRNRSVRAMNSLPPEIQKDIGWPVSPRNDPQVSFSGLLLGSAR
ncbi:hypothetical protein [Mesorhizobium sp.]|uniref:hypothetical protein n=1 Tax=Mesorhizobium sp. TaxID=1871066 RepID=UPI00338E26D6